MTEWTVRCLADVVGGQLLSGQPQAAFSGVSSDTRTLKPGEAFFALRGPNFDGQDFIETAQAKGAVVAVVSEPPSKCIRQGNWPVVRVEDTLAALGRFAAWHRRQMPATVIAITGSAGKTTTKELVAHLLCGFYQGVKAPKSFNNAIGVPLTLLQMRREDRFAVVEVGTNAFGETAALGAVVQPDIAVVTCIGDAHLERFGGRWGVAWEKAHLVAAMGASGMAVLNADDQWCRRMVVLSRGRTVTFGFSSRAQVRAQSVADCEGGAEFIVDGQRFRSPMSGRHNVLNALAAVAVVRQFGVPLAEAAVRISTFAPPPMRMQRLRFGTVTVIADEYNASPTSVAAALAEYRGVQSNGRKVFVFADMLELGRHSKALHERVGRWAAYERLDGLWTVGPLARHAASAALRRGMAGDAVHSCADTEEACRRIADWVRAKDVILLKGSRGMGLERVVAAIAAHWGAGQSASVQRQAFFDAFRPASIVPMC